ncbi:FAD-dependent monooxygenase [Aurantimonas sp. HBX-1]|uniref:FAD-dependent monooxygenase n=1 Tax=Aurantimonas sp. HBX-1 TaxID=2906072 RepID=UPI001F1955F7|nr:FAD-dependent monooxygenase [Aurantimonas sp. HBX-1]UIJ72593.1 FAD-dependent monooxygenase [Aurantimonas sp. HBX-1]
MPGNKNVLISGAGVAGPILGWWLHHYGFHPVIVERADELRTGGQPIDLWGSAVDVVERMGLLPEIEAARTRNDCSIIIAPGHDPFEADVGKLLVELGGRHVEILRGKLVSIVHAASQGGVEYIFGDTITRLEERSDGVVVTFEKHGQRDFDLVIGADGQHSNVRHLAFGEEAHLSRYMGGYVCGYTTPDFLGVENTLHQYVAVGKTVATAPIRQTGDLAVIFAFRCPEPLGIGHDDVEGQKRLLREHFEADGWEVPRLLEFLDDARDFYFYPISQIHMESWVKDRIALVGDAGYSPAPAVGGGSSLAVSSAYVLAGELAEAMDDPARGLQDYQSALDGVVRASRQIAPAGISSLLPSSEFAISLRFLLGPLLLATPSAIRRIIPVVPRKAVKGLHAIAEIPIGDYEPGSGADASRR